MTRVAINGFGRIGRSFFRAAYGRDDFEIVAINDLVPADNLAYLLKYDTVYGNAKFTVTAAEKSLVVENKSIPVFSEKDPLKLPWRDMGIDIVVESTGFFTDAAKARTHIDAGAKRVVITAPGKGEGLETILMGANEEKFGTCDISSNASCTTNAASPLIGVLDEAIGIERALLNTTHAYTATQAIVDSHNSKDFREGRAGAQNIIPSTTGAALATSKAIPALKNIFDGISMRVPVISGSIVDFTFIAKKNTTAEEINNIFKKEAKSDKWKGILTVTEEPIVSSDILGNPHGAIVDATMTRVVDGDLVKVLSWYDNEWGYCSMLIKHIESLKSLL